MMKNINAAQYLEYIKERCEDEFTFFVRYFFKHLKSRKFIFSDHHYVICNALMDVFFGRVTYLIINIAPRYSKTELVVKMFSAWCYAKNPACEFIHLSYSDSLALDNSDTIKQILKSFEFTQLWPDVAIRQNKDSKKSWETTSGGNYYATAAGGSVTGFGAGKVDDFENGNGFGGCFPYDELVFTDRGYLKIGYIVENNLNVKVRSYCVDSGKFEFKEIDKYWHNPPNEILEVGLSNGDSFKCTPDHEIFTKHGKVKAKDLNSSDVFIHFSGSLDHMYTNTEDINCIKSGYGPITCYFNLFISKLFSILPRRIRKIFSNAFPCFPRLYLSNNPKTNPIEVSKKSWCLSASKYLNNLSSIKLRSWSFFKKRESAMTYSILHIIRLSSVSKIFKPVINFVSIKMTRFKTFFSLTNKTEKNKLMNIHNFNLAFNGQGNSEISFGVWLLFESLTFQKVSLPIINNFSVEAFNITSITNHIKRFIRRDVNPCFIKSVGHAEKTYCLEVRSNNNFTVSKSQVLVSNCILVDDPLKPDDAFSEPKRNSVNARWDGTIKSRFNSTKTPCIVVAQRLHDDDFCAMLEKDEEYNFKVLKLPTIVNEETDNEKALWESKHSLERLHKMKKKSPYMFSSQMQQSPSPLGGGLIKGHWFGRYKILPKLKYRAMFGDTAQKKKEANDYQVAICFGLGEDGYLYIIDVLRDKFEAYELEKRFPDFWQKHLNADSSKLRYFGIEDKSSGTELIQKIKNTIKPAIPVKAIPRIIDKLTRVMDIQGYIQSGYVKIPENANWTHDFITECEAFTANDTHKNDDQIDTLCDAISNMLHKTGSMIHIG